MKLNTVLRIFKNGIMKLFQLHRKYFSFIGIEPLQPFQKNQKLIVLWRRLLVFIPFIACAILSSAFLGYKAKTLEEYSDSFYFSISMVHMCTILTVLVCKAARLFKLIEDIEKLIEQRKIRKEICWFYYKNCMKCNKISHVIWCRYRKSPVEAKIHKIEWKYWEMDKSFLFPHGRSDCTCNFDAKIHHKFLPLFHNRSRWGRFQLTVSNLVRYNNGWKVEFSYEMSQLLFAFFSSRSPFNWRTPIGFLIIYTIQSAAVIFSCHLCTCYIVTFTAPCYMVFTFCNEIKDEIHSLEESNKARQKSVELMKRVGDIVEFHAAAKQLSSIVMIFIEN